MNKMSGECTQYTVTGTMVPMAASTISERPQKADTDESSVSPLASVFALTSEQTHH